MRRPLAIAAFLLPVVGASARADTPTPDAVKAAVAPGLGKLAGAIAVPFTYEGLTFDDDQQYQLVAKCEAKFGAHGTIKKAAQVPAFVECLAVSDARNALVGKPVWSVFDPAKADDLWNVISVQTMDKKISKGYEAKLKKAAKGSVFVVHTSKPDDVDGYWDEASTIFHAHQDATGVKLDGITAAVSYMAPG